MIDYKEVRLFLSDLMRFEGQEVANGKVCCVEGTACTREVRVLVRLQTVRTSK